MKWLGETMKHACLKCGREKSADSTCVHCNPPPPDRTMVGPEPDTRVERTLQSGIDRDAMTITHFMAAKGMEGGVDLTSSTQTVGATASAVLTGEKGQKYKLGNLVSAGGQGAIIDAKDLNLRRSVAMKVIIDPEHASKEQVLRFIEEAQVTSQLEHPGIVPVHELGVDAGGNVFYTMKYVQGLTLREILKRIKSGDADTIKQYPLPRLLTIFQRGCDAVAFAHSKNVIHRDLKPDNIMTGEYGETLVLDWGLARVKGLHANKEEIRQVDSLRLDVGSDLLKTLDGRIMGTPGYMAPEQAQGNTDAVDSRSDIYSLGAILYHILTLQAPVTGKSVDEILEKVKSGKIENPTKVGKKDSGVRVQESGEEPLTKIAGNMNIPASLAAVAMKALALKPADRYQSVKELQADIEAYQTGFSTSAEKANWLRRTSLLLRRRKKEFSLAAIGILATIAVTGFIFQNNLRQMAKWGRGEDITPKNRTEIEKNWILVSGEWEVRNGKFGSAMSARDNEQRAIYKEVLKGDIAVECKGMVETSDALQKGGDLSILLCTTRNYERGYFFQLGGKGNTTAMIQRADPKSHIILSAIDFQLLPGRIYNMRAEKEREWLRLFCDDKLLLECRDLAFWEDGMMALYTWGPGKKFWDVRTYERGVPEFTSPLEVGDEFVRTSKHGNTERQKRYLQYAAEAYTRVWESHGTRPLGYAALLRRANILLELGKPEDARKDIIELEREGQSFDTLLLKGNISFALGKLDDACTTFSKILKEHPAGRLHALSSLRQRLGETTTIDLTDESRTRLWRLYAENWKTKTLNCSKSGLHSLDFLKGLNFESIICNDNQITSLEPLRGMQLVELLTSNNFLTTLESLKGMPLKRLNCDCNQITTLDPLQGMPLTFLSCEYNQITTLKSLTNIPITILRCRYNQITLLDPVRDMPLDSLRCAGNKIASLEPVKGMPLKELNCDNNNLANLEALRGMPLTILRCSYNQITSLEPLQGMPLTFLSCQYNQITTLEPLRGMPLKELDCDNNNLANLEALRGMPLTVLCFGNNNLANLEALRGMPLTVLRCGNNLLDTLEPLNGMPLRSLNCSANQITSLQPLKGMTLDYLICSRNLLTTLTPVDAIPPSLFFFDSDTIPDKELERLIVLWSSKPIFARNKQDAEILLALRKGQFELMKTFASSLNTHKYLMIPYSSSWTDAEEMSRKMGGHLATMTSDEETSFVLQLLGKGNYAQIGCKSNPNGKPEWITGEEWKMNIQIIRILPQADFGVIGDDGQIFYVSDNNSPRSYIVEWDD